jgi:hypothetical protein
MKVKQTGLYYLFLYNEAENSLFYMSENVHSIIVDIIEKLGDNQNIYR